MNIAIFVDAYLPIKNGVVTSVNQLKAGMEGEGHKVYIFTVNVPGCEPLPDVYRFPSIKFGKKSESMLGLVSHRKVLAYMRELKIDLIHTHSEFSLGRAGKKAARKLGLPMVHTNHTMWQYYTHYLPGFLTALVSVEKVMSGYQHGFKYFISPSVKAETYFKPLSDPDAIFRIIPNGVDQDKFVTKSLTPADLAAQRTALGLKDGDQVAMFAGRIGPEKRVIELLTCLLPLLKRRPSFKMMFVGDGPSLADLKHLAAENGLGGQVLFPGFIPWTEMHKFYSVSQIFLTASISEVHPMTLIEGAIAGLPAITRDDDAYKTLLLEGENGHLVPTDADLPVKLEALLDDPARLAAYAKKSKELSLIYTAHHHVEKVKAFYEFILADHKQKISTLK